ncbi:phage recombination related exonuclease [Vibrio maritimus]|uniref:Phage recombination related exonuclease n=1 Tax=Vibrio maritimus TaxID=990268 RepID=A0A090S950_9VIBR|nr:phage recombination related exonuclease [Vibrio maritimus]
MKFNRIEIDNFMAVGEVTINVDNKGLVLIQGENLDDTSQNSNGAGKSTIVEALQWALFNETARGDSGDSVINRTAKKNCRVLIQIVDGDREYNIIRHRKHKDNKNRVLLLDVTNRSDVVDLTLGTDKATQEQINKIIGCSSDVFRAAIYSGQESQIDLPSLTDKHLKTIVEEAAGIDKMQLAHRIARERYAQTVDAVKTLEASIARVDDSIETATKQSEYCVTKSKEFAEQKVTDINEGKKKAASAAKKAKELKAKLDASDKAGLTAQLEEVTARIKGVDGEVAQQKKLSKSLTELTMKLKMAQSEFTSGKTDAERLKKQIDEVVKEIGTACSSCGHAITESSIGDRRIALTNELKSKVANVKTKGVEAKDLKDVLSKAQEELSTFESSMTDISEQVTQQKTIQSALNDVSALESSVIVAVNAAKTARASLDEIGKREDPYVEMKEREDEKLKLAKTQRENLDTELTAAKAKRQTAGCVVDVFSPSGIRAHILDTVTPFLNDRTARYLGILSDGNIQAIWSTLSKTAKGELREKFAIEITSTTGGASYKSLSGGEKRKVRLATTLALQDLVSSRASKPIELWIGDEIDDAVDVSGLERLMTVLEEKAKEKGTVLIISHNQLSDWVRQHATVVKKGGTSTMTGVLNLERDEELV